MYPETQAGLEIPNSSGHDLGTPPDTAEHHNDVSAFEESIESEELEDAFASEEENEGERAQEWSLREIKLTLFLSSEKNYS